MRDQTKNFFAVNWFKLFFVVLAVILLMIYFSRESRLDDCILQARFKAGEDLTRYNSSYIEEIRSKQVNECINRYSFK